MSLIDYNKIVINLNKDRLKWLNYDYYKLEGSTKPSEFVLKNMPLKYNQKADSKRFKGKLGCFTAHMKALQFAIDKKLDNIIILEDDALLDTSIYMLNHLEAGCPRDICLFGGVLQHPKTYNKQKEFRENEAPEIIKTFKCGFNEIDYDKFRFTGAWAIFYPDYHHCQKIMNYIKHSGKKLTHYDIYLAKNKLVKYLAYPSVFTHNDRMTGSSINCRPEGIIKNYIKLSGYGID
jgi:hypothetical protein